MGESEACRAENEWRKSKIYTSGKWWEKEKAAAAHKTRWPAEANGNEIINAKPLPKQFGKG